ncbi:MAG: sulfurtransferase TusA family protein [Alphaproteobacteria bacterium]
MTEHDRDLDCEGLLCPLPVLKARKTLTSMQTGQILIIRTTDPMANIDLPHFCKESGNHYLQGTERNGVTTHLVRRG